MHERHHSRGGHIQLCRTLLRVAPSPPSHTTFVQQQNTHTPIPNTPTTSNPTRIHPQFANTATQFNHEESLQKVVEALQKNAASSDSDAQKSALAKQAPSLCSAYCRNTKRRREIAAAEARARAGGEGGSGGGSGGGRRPKQLVLLDHSHCELGVQDVADRADGRGRLLARLLSEDLG